MGWFDDLKGVGHTTLDVLGMVPVIGAVADLGNAAWYYTKGDYQNASLSLAAAVPGAGLTVGGLRIAKALKGAEAGMDAAKTSVKAAEKAYKPALQAQRKAGKAAGAAKRAEKAAQDALDAAKTRTPGLGSPPKAALVDKARRELADKKKLLKEARRQVRSGSLRRAAPALRQAEKAKDKAQATLKKAQEIAKKGSGVTYRGRDFGRKKLRATDIGLGVAGIHYSEQAKGEAARAAAEAKAKAEAEGKSKKQQEEEAKKAAQAVLDREKGLLDKESSERRAKKGARKQRKAARAQREREEQRERRDFKESQRRFDKRMQLKEARLGRKEERKAANQADDRIKLAADMAGKMAEDPDFFKKNREEKYDLFARAKRLGITADQFNSFINRNYENAKREYKLREFDRESAEGRAWLNEKLDQPSLNQMGVPTPSARGRNIGRLKTGKVSPTEPEVRESVREFDEDERKRQRSRDRGARGARGARGVLQRRGRGSMRNFTEDDRRGMRRIGTARPQEVRGRRRDSGLPRGAIGTDSYGNIIFPEGDIRNSQMVVRRMEGPQYLKPRLEEKQRPDNRRRGKRRSRR